MAVGASAWAIRGLVAREGVTLVAGGLVLGVAMSLALTRLLASQLYGVQFWDPLALGIAAVSLVFCALVAAMIPAARAASISPMHALRAE